MPHEVETMFYAGEKPWHGLGVGVEEAKTSAEAIALAGLDWEVALGPVYAGGPDKESAREVPGRLAVYRVTDGMVYHTNATSRYQPWQNREAFDFTDSLIKDGVALYETAGSLFNGARVWLLCRLPAEMRVLDDEYLDYILVSTTHNLLGAVEVFPTRVRVVCNNTYRQAQAGAQTTIKIAHTKGMETKLQAAARTLNVTTEASRRFAEWAGGLGKVKLSDQKEQAIVDGIFGPMDDATSAQKRAAVALFQQIYQAERERQGANAYSMLQAVTGYADHRLTYIGDNTQRAEARFNSTLINGRALDFKNKGVEAILAYTK